MPCHFFLKHLEELESELLSILEMTLSKMEVDLQNHNSLEICQFVRMWFYELKDKSYKQNNIR
jgi:hypothetical protein